MYRYFFDIMRVFKKALQFKSGLISFIILSLTWLSGFGQYSETLYGTNEGLSHPSVLDIEEDEDGFIWVFTFFGLNRFDGYGFREYMVEDSSYSRRITYRGWLLKDTRGRIWVECGTNETFIIDLELDRLQLTIPRSDFRDIEEGDEGSWILTNQKSIYLVSEKPGLAFEYEKWQVPEEAWIINYLFRLKDGTFLATSYYGLFRLTFEHDSIQAEKIHIEDHLEKDFKIDMDTRFFSVNDEIYLLNGNEILKTNFNRQGINADSVYSLSLLELDFPEIGLTNGQPISAVINGRENEIFIRSLNGIYCYNLLSGKAERIRAEKYGGVDNSEGNFLEALYYSTEGILWAGTNKGLLKIVIGNKPFHTLLPEPDNPDDLTTTKSGGIIVDSRKDLWLGGDGLYQFRKSTEGDYRKINHYLPDTSDPFSITEKYIAPAFEDSKKRLWFGIYGMQDVQWMDLNSP
ncbi:MAG: hypothetical protein QNK35_15050, partial [Bacteroides sp.]|nr:hypothetical protein [Bacteroides sp.]